MCNNTEINVACWYMYMFARSELSPGGDTVFYTLTLSLNDTTDLTAFLDQLILGDVNNRSNFTRIIGYTFIINFGKSHSTNRFLLIEKYM